jgi:hypothetical protein
MKLPSRVRRGEPVKAEDFNLLLDALRSLEIQPGKGYNRTIKSDGTFLTIKKPSSWRPVGVSDFSPFAVREIEEDGAGWRVRIEPGRVISMNPVTVGEGVEYYVPDLAEASPMDARDADGKLTWFEVATGQTVYCRIKRNDLGNVSENPLLIASEDLETSTDHYEPPGPDTDGSPEIYQYRALFTVTAADGEPGVSYSQKSDIQIEPYIQTGENTGEGADVFRKWNRATQQLEFYRVHGCYGIAASNAAGRIKVEFEAENIGLVDDGWRASVYVEPDPLAAEDCAAKAQFRAIGEGAVYSRRQIEILEDDDLIRIMGNGKDGSAVFQDCDGAEVGRIEWEDGLVTSEGPLIFTLGNCTDTTGTGEPPP